MNTIDIIDQAFEKMRLTNPIKRWPKVPFMFIIQVCIYNAFVVYTHEIKHGI